jgi:serine/threonine protein kinase
MDLQFPEPITVEAEDLIRKMLVIKPDQRISIPEIFCHPWLKSIIGPDGLPLEGETDDYEEDSHDFQMSLSFQRQECNLNPFSVAGPASGSRSRNEAVEGEIT